MNRKRRRHRKASASSRPELGRKRLWAFRIVSLVVLPLLLVATAMFLMGLGCTLARRNLIMILIGVEIMLNAVGLVLVGGSSLWQKVDGQVFVIFLMAMTAAEVGISLAMVVYLRRRKGTINANAFDEMNG